MPITHPLIKKNALELRRYQESAVASAIDNNTLVVLPTGLGKTMIAAVLAAHRLHTFPGSKILFLAPTRPLVVQHSVSFKKILNIGEDQMAVLTGKDPPEKRFDIWENSRVIFATPQTIENDIIRGIDISSISLIIFDEAHRAVGDYAYTFIADEYTKKMRGTGGDNKNNKNKMELILGLTASPGSDIEQVKNITRNLHINRIEAKTDHDPDVKPYIQKVKIKWIKIEILDEFKTIINLFVNILKDELNVLKEKEYLNTASPNKVNKKDLLKIQAQIRQEIISGMDSYQQASTAASAIKILHAIELIETQGIAALGNYIDRLRNQRSKSVTALFSDTRMMKAVELTCDLKERGIDHPKLDALVDIINDHKNQRVIVFTQYRDSVSKIVEKLNEKLNGNLNESKIPIVSAHEFVGQAKRDGIGGMSQKKQIATLEKFKEGTFNVLVATSVAEEGLDIPQVDIIIFYEPIPSEIRTIQRRGRTGRLAPGAVYVLMAKGTRDEGYYWASQHRERKMEKNVREMRRGFDEAFGQQNLVEYAHNKNNINNDENTDNTDNLKNLPDSHDDQNSQNHDKALEFEGSYSKNEKCTPGRIKIYADVRERGSDVIGFLREMKNVELVLWKLDVGDFILSDRVAVERKIVPDFINSIIDGRLLTQAQDIARNFAYPVMIIEGYPDYDIYSQRNIHPNAVRGALSSIAVDLGISIIPTRDEEDTAMMLYTIAKREQIDLNRCIALRGEKRAMSLPEKQRFVVESLPNVSAVLARRLLLHFGSIEKIFRAREKELMEVDLIGEKKAKAIRAVIREKYTE